LADVSEMPPVAGQVLEERAIFFKIEERRIDGPPGRAGCGIKALRLGWVDQVPPNDRKIGVVEE
jgi:hypothetical protein